MTRSAWLGAAIAAVLAITLILAGAGAPKPAAANAAPARHQAPAPTLDPVIPDSRPLPSASPEAPSQATSSHKETK